MMLWLSSCSVSTSEVTRLNTRPVEKCAHSAGDRLSTFRKTWCTSTALVWKPASTQLAAMHVQMQHHTLSSTRYQSAHLGADFEHLGSQPGTGSALSGRPGAPAPPLCKSLHTAIAELLYLSSTLDLNDGDWFLRCSRGQAQPCQEDLVHQHRPCLEACKHPACSSAFHHCNRGTLRSRTDRLSGGCARALPGLTHDPVVFIIVLIFSPNTQPGRSTAPPSRPGAPARTTRWQCWLSTRASASSPSSMRQTGAQPLVAGAHIAGNLQRQGREAWHLSCKPSFLPPCTVLPALVHPASFDPLIPHWGVRSCQQEQQCTGPA